MFTEVKGCTRQVLAGFAAPSAARETPRKNDEEYFPAIVVCMNSATFGEVQDYRMDLISPRQLPDSSSVVILAITITSFSRHWGRILLLVYYNFLVPL